MDIKRFSIEDLYRFEWIASPKLTPDGKTAVFSLRTVNEQRDGYRARIHAIDLESGQERCFTWGNHKDRLQDVGRDQILLASDRSGDTQLFLLPLGGGEARQASFIKGGVKTAKLSPSGEWIAAIVTCREGAGLEYRDDAPEPLLARPTGHLSARLDEGEDGRVENARDREEQAGNHSPQSRKDAPRRLEPYRVKRLHYKADGEGTWDGTYRQLAVIDARTGEARLLTEGPYDVSELAWSPDETQLAFSSQRVEDEFSFVKDIYLVSLEGGEMRRISGGDLSLGDPSFSPDGRLVACYGHDMSDGFATQGAVYVGSVDGGGFRSIIPEDFPYATEATGMSDMRAHDSIPGPAFTADGSAVVGPFSRAGAVGIAAYGLNGAVQPWVEGEREVFAFDYCPAADVLLFAATDPSNPNDLYLKSAGEGERRLTRKNPWLEERAMARVEEFSAKAPDGTTLQAWRMVPPGEGTSLDEEASSKKGGMPRAEVSTLDSEGVKSFPVILEVHGGPHAMYSYSFFFEFQLLAARGYAVVYGNPRGSSGFGQEFLSACRGDYGGADYLDVMSILDAALASDSRLDPGRLGVTGGSYGGFMTNWIVGRTNRFKAAVTQRSISNWISFHGVSDIGYFFTRGEMRWSPENTPWEDIDTLWDHSPLRHASNVETPLLILHGEEDLRCPVEQAEQLFVALRGLGKTVDFYRFPKSDHNLSRSGIPYLRTERYRLLCEWFDRFMELSPIVS